MIYEPVTLFSIRDKIEVIVKSFQHKDLGKYM